MGGILEDEYFAEFSTPIIEALQAYPTADKAYPLDTILFVAFDQAIDKDEIVKSITFSAQKGKVYCSAKLAKQSDIEANVAVEELVSQYSQGNWIAFLPSKSLPKNTNVTVKVPLASREGPLRSVHDYIYSFTTYGGLSAFVSVSPSISTNVEVYFTQPIVSDKGTVSDLVKKI